MPKVRFCHVATVALAWLCFSVRRWAFHPDGGNSAAPVLNGKLNDDKSETTSAA